MRTTSTIATLLVGAVLGVGMIMACSDDSPGDADAATCDCPPAEPPLAGRIARTRVTTTIDPNAVGVQSSSCPAGGTILGGSCRMMEGNRNIALTEAGIVNGGGQGYECHWSSTSASAGTGIVEAICLMPAQ